MPVARPAIHPEPECRTALVRELRVVASAAGYGDRCGTRPRARRVYAGPERADRFPTISFQCKQAKRGRQKYISILETHFDGNSLRYQGAYEAGSAYRIQPYIRSNARAVDRSLALKIRYSVSDGPRGHCTWGSVPRVGQISRQFHRTSSRSPKHATDPRSP